MRRRRTRGLRLAFALTIAACLALPAAAVAAGTGSIEGTVTEAAALKAPIAHTLVCASSLTGVEPTFECAETNVLGVYKLEGLPAGEYVVEFTGAVCEGGRCGRHPYITQFYNAQTSFEAANKVIVSEGKTATGIDAALQEGGTIEGTVVKAAGGEPIAGAEACAFSETIGNGGCATTNASGKYKIEGLATASNYVVGFFYETCSEVGGSFQCKKPYVLQFFEGALSAASAKPVSVKAPEATEGIDAHLVVGGSISGTVTVASIYRQPISGLFVCARSAETGECASTNAKGEYTVEGLASGSYKVEFGEQVCGESGGHFECNRLYRKQFYNGKASEGEADPIGVSAPLAVSGVDASMLELAPKQPGLTSAPALSGAAAVGASLSCSQGSWANNPTSLSYAWLRDGVVIPGQTAASYVVQSADEGHTLACQVTASNAAGSAIASSNAVTVPAKPPAKPPAEKPAGEKPAGEKPAGEKPATKGVAVAKGSATVVGETVQVALSCPSPGACGGVLKLVGVAKSAKGHGRHRRGAVVIGEASFAIPAGGHLTLQVHLNARGRRLLARSGRQGLAVRLTGSGVKARALVIRRASHRPHKKRKG